MIKTEHLSKYFNKNGRVVKALENANLEVSKGEWVAISGPSGSGKSTLLMVLSGLMQPDGGGLTIDNTDVLGMTQSQKAKWRQAHVGMVFQEFYLFPYLSVLENVLFAAKEQNQAIQAKAFNVLELVGLHEHAMHRPDELSMGQRQKTAIARALINDPELLLVDEPTGNLDPRSSMEIMDIFRALHVRKSTIVLVTHNPDVARCADTRYELSLGIIAKSG
ncbi:MAG: hypothetical protein A2268_14515 [Candidatus Raymondbacteria bacterium RifOxyA12_full_50_37]|uniref:ABC transporter domain-containing protein n=1 Tax=Candidatus Raymondbacteria bacterium RIFOXYD12_FULL_49_13 TaxID=1817890 RepID=A0A1F7F2B1_UNCRA|nr:MAG: hypothetical protein A2268_14515 [Candidatus Raymondbacteria bacterium RifOxyA12_full_50_37]OGJ88632.1 MAG: hypothetical protein A2248_20450 [Candidatus Raymondbacteria bacterium RIFOXYA2_FULL_49_16]OGJ90516.1 MAG: hypothetical protein A2350_18700 [Candidatus Raymondbacteria bacterium RifOxyB12_full_50_8]OGK00805.1 MAG: hypothetical protein A2519_07705 [Candidatus Raymondbacteria bacterium RIFOXYD12_FULL_49_13]OGK02892.1 MAG: hypothetical protein A2487_17860 [Candidatus Raymondbacteria 